MTRSYLLDPAVGGPLPHPAIDYEGELNPAQREAVLTLEGPLLCIAGAGSGKTKTLVFRVARLVETGVPPEQILLLTFTRKAALNMLERAATLVGGSTHRAAGGTYHAFAHLMLRQYGSAIGLRPDFSIIDDGDAADILNHLRLELGAHTKGTRFPQKKTLQEMLSKSVNRGLPLPELIELEYGHFREHLDDIQILAGKFQEFKLAHGLLDYDDLLIDLRVLLEDHPAIRQALARRFRYVMADEYQDTNPIQARITVLLGQEHGNVMVVGDDAQSIYSFRGATVRNILEFPQQFPAARLIRLEQNYRSTGAILAATNHLMTHAREGFPKQLFSTRPAGEKPALLVCGDEAEQSLFVAQRILELREEGIPLSRIAVLFRSGYHSFHLELELRKRNIPFTKWGGFKFLEASHIKDLLAHLRVIQNPADRIAWQRILLLVEGIGTKSLPALFAAIQAAADPFDLTAVKAPKRAREGLERLSAALQEAWRRREGPPQRVIEAITDYYLPILKAVYFDDHPKRVRDLDQVALLSERFDDLTGFLSELALEPPGDSRDGQLAVSADDEERLVLSTIHSAKGLEWHSVFIIWTLEGRFPSFAALRDPEGLEEERRLMYVAMTRAQENLYLCYPVYAYDPASGTILAKPSRFLDEIGPDLLERWEIRRRER
ncbi:MAG: ATP-dependent DNA helicase UvrD/PcrA [Candidatus Ozemobacter sibiricus]|uniref:DNA 3'-5' helicase n=1 Tax=Candidatus Ozemobacter sibiricus TaxID=2268124 RepID=A0A367ZKF7_9BACT|nr:MAG: ATP-dependent DNA helicase UvrD/PcrA [Candidatus Ozemobacter sibiricus]